MKATYCEVWGVFLGFVRPMMGGLLCARASGRVHWTWGYHGWEAALTESVFEFPSNWTEAA